MPLLARLKNTKDPWRIVSEHWVIMVLNQLLQSNLHLKNLFNVNKQKNRFEQQLACLFLFDIKKIRGCKTWSAAGTGVNELVCI